MSTANPSVFEECADAAEQAVTDRKTTAAEASAYKDFDWNMGSPRSGMVGKSRLFIVP
jgi:hypothetical protein